MTGAERPTTSDSQVAVRVVWDWLPDPPGAAPDVARRAAALLTPGVPPHRAEGRRDQAAPVEPVHTFMPAPSGRLSQLLVPADDRQAAAALFHLRHLVRRRGWRLWAARALTLALRAGLAQRAVRTRLDVVARPGGLDLPAASLVDYLRTVLGSDVQLGLVLGRGEPHQTAVVLAVDRGGALVGFAKVATGPLAQRLLANEASALRRVANLDVPELARLVTARLVRAEHWNGLFVLVTTPLDLGLGQRDSSRLGTSAEVIRALAATGSVERTALGSSTYWARTMGRANTVLAAETLPPDVRQPLRRLLTALEVAYGAQEIDLGGSHGDWLPWNRIRRGGVVVVWDWEYWTDSAPIGFDVLHHHCGAIFFPSRLPIDVALARARERSAGELAALGIVGADNARLYSLYVLEFFLRRLEIAIHGGGADDARIFPAILRVVADVSAAMTRS